VPDPGRLKELLFPGNSILLAPRLKPGGKTSCVLIAARKRNSWILTNTTFHSRIAEALIWKGLLGFEPRSVEREVRLPGYLSRFDFLVNDGMILEVKGCTLETRETGLFPDAPTSRGARQVREMARYIRDGGEGTILFIVTVPWAQAVCSNPETDPSFAGAIDDALEAGGRVVTAVVSLRESGIHYEGMIPFKGRFDYRSSIHQTRGGQC